MKLHVHAWGDPGAPPVICLHGVTTHGERFARLAERLPGFQVLAPDLRGHGRSGWEPPWNLRTLLDDVLETVEVDRAVWIGHSLGGRLVLELAAREPDRVERGVLLDPAIRIRPDVALALADGARVERVYANREDAMPPGYGGPLVHTPPARLDEEREQHLEPCRDGFRWRYSASAASAILGELAAWGPAPEELRVPLLLVVGEQSVVGPRQLARFQRALGDRLQVVTVPGGHVVLWDAFDETAAALATFLEAA